MDEDIRHTIGCNSPQIDGDTGEHMGTSSSVGTSLQWSYRQDQEREMGINGITFQCSCRYLAIPLGTYMHVTLQYYLQFQRVGLFPLNSLSIGSRIWEAHPRQLDETLSVMGKKETL